MMIIVVGFLYIIFCIGFYWKIDKVCILGKEISFVCIILVVFDEGFGFWSEFLIFFLFVM